MPKKRTNGGTDRTEVEEPKAVRVTRTNERSDAFLTIYANDAQVQTTPWDIRLTFGQIIGAPTGANASLVVKETAEVYMSPQFAKRVAMVLIEQLRGYEETVGAVPVPPSLKD
jgi:hypothetical protein